VGRFEGYPNRDSTVYIGLYDIGEAETLFRGTLRNEGHCAAWYWWVTLGLFGTEVRTDLGNLTYRNFMQDLVGELGDLKTALAGKWKLPQDASAIANLEWLGMFEDEPLSVTRGANVDVLASRMLEKCAYQKGERDMIVMLHEFVVRYADGDRKVYSRLVEYGVPGGDSAMARTVGLPLAIATRMTMEGAIETRGVVTPVVPEIYNPILDELEGIGISFDERVE
jgi:saccharopine dehydrogenase-like NADP-dependent oxidoreductase